MSRGLGWSLLRNVRELIGGIYVRALWFESIASGTTGTVGAPVSGATFVMDQWSAGVDALVSQMSGGLPTFQSAVTAGSVIVTATFDEDGNYTLSGTPSAYPVALVYVYRVQFQYYDDSYSLGEAEVFGDPYLKIASNLSDLDNAATARGNLGLTIGSTVQAYDAGLASIAGLTTEADRMLYTTAPDVYAVGILTAAGRALLDDANAEVQRSTLGLGTIVTQNANAVALTGGNIDGIIIGGTTAAAGTFLALKCTDPADENGVGDRGYNDLRYSVLSHNHNLADLTDHSHHSLDGLSDDDHGEYWNDLRGDAKISTHAGDDDAHHAKYTDAEVDARIVVQNTNPTGTIDVAIDALIASHAGIATAHQDAPALIASHAGVAAAHHARYADAEAVSAMGAKGDANPLNHDRYTHPSGIQCTLATGDVPDPLIIGEIKAKDANGLKLSDDGGLGPVVKDGGYVTNAYQTAFLVTKNATQTDIALGSAVTITWETELIDQGSDFADNTFTAPVDGLYQLSAQIYLNQVDIDATFLSFDLYTSNRSYKVGIISPKFTGDLPYLIINLALLVDMDANDTAYLAVWQGGGAAQLDIFVLSYFSGFLAC